MANLRKKVINKWDDGILTSPRSSDASTSNGAQMVKGFDVYNDAKKLMPMQSWDEFITDAEKSYGIRALGGQSDTIYGLGNALTNWYGLAWNYRVRVDVTSQYHLASGLPLYVDMSLLPSEFWDNVREDMADIRVTSISGQSYACHTENVDYDGETGTLWVDGNIIDAGSPSIVTVKEESGTGTTVDITNAPYAIAFPVTLTGQPINYLVFNAYGNVSTGHVVGDMIVDLYSDTAGTPNALVTNLGTINVDRSMNMGSVGVRDIELAFDTLSLTGNYHLVFRCPTADGSGYVIMTYGNSGTTTIKKADDSGISSWSDVDTTATPYYKLKYYSNPSAPEKYFYVYYGNSTATLPEYGLGAFSYADGGREIFRNNGMRFAYTFGDDKSSNQYYSDGATGSIEAFTTDPQAFVDSFVGNGLRTFDADITTDTDDDIGINGSDMSMSLLVYTTAYEEVTLLKDTLETVKVQLDASGKIVFFVTATGGATSNVTTASISTNQWHVIDCVFNDDAYIYVDGVLQTFDINDENFSGDTVDNGVVINSGNNCRLGQLWGWNDDITAYQVATKFNNFSKDNFYTIGAQVAQTSVNLEFGGVQLYSKLISSGDWSEYLDGGRPVRNTSYSPVNAFIDDTGTYFVLSQSPENQGILTIAARDTFDVLNPTYITLSTLGTNNSKVAIQSEVATDNVQYCNRGNTSLVSVDPDDASVFVAQSTIQSLSAWRTYLAVGSNTRNKGYIDIWDLADTLATDKATTGTGNLRIVGNAGDTLFAVTDNFIDDVVKSSNKPSMEVWQYIGNGEMERTHYIEVPAVVDDSTYIDNWERAVSNFKIQRNKQTLFYARIPNVSDGSTFDEGFWAVGKNTDGRLSLTLQISTEGLGMPENVFGFAQQVFFVKKDGGIVRLADDTYNDVSLYKTLKMNEGNTEIEKKLVGVEIITEPLESGQTVSVYYKQNGDSERTKIFDMTGEDEIVYETTYDINESNLPHYKEIEFDIESTGGKSGILEFNYKYEYLSDII
jgi:hypothetical protein